MSWLDLLFLGTPMRQWLVVLATALITHLLVLLLRKVLVARFERLAAASETKLDDILVAALRRTGYMLSIGVSLYAASVLVFLPERLAEHMRTAATISLIVQVAAWLFAGAGEAVTALSPDDDGAGRDATMASGIGTLLKVVIGLVMILTILANLGVEVSALLAGLGVGGLAAALAVRATLGDFFASICIYFDRPFDIGDYVVVGAEMGTIEHIGLRTTKIRALGGEQLIFANEDLSSSRIRNFQRLEQRRAKVRFVVRYETPHAELAEIPGMVQAAVEACPNTRFDRCHLDAYAESGLSFELVFFVLSAEYLDYMDALQAVHLGIHRGLEERGVALALPTRRLLIEGEGGGAPLAA